MKKLFLLAAFVTLIFSARVCLATDIFLFPAHQELKSDQVVVALGLDTGSDKINAVTGEISYDPNLLELVSLSNANSIIPLWVETPSEKSPGSVSFSGIVPGGFGGQGKIISLIFKAKTGGHDIAKAVRVKKIEILRNDGVGTAVETKIITVSPSIIKALDISSSSDTNAPELFKPLISKNDPLLGDKSYLLFNTTDKGSGVDKYFVLESNSSLNLRDKEALSLVSWQEAESPYLLQDQVIARHIYVKVADRAGNILVVELEQGKKFYQFWWFWVIIIMALIGVCLWWKRKFL